MTLYCKIERDSEIEGVRFALCPKYVLIMLDRNAMLLMFNR